MINDITQNSCRIEYHADKQESRPVVSCMAAEEKLGNNQKKIPMLKNKRAVCISTFNSQTLNRTAKLSELVYNAQKFNISLIAIQEHSRLIHEEPLNHDSLGDNWLLITTSATRNTLNAVIGGVGILLNPHAKMALESIETISDRTLMATFNGNPKCTVILTYSPVNVTSEDATKEYYSELTTLIHQVPKHNVLLLCGDMNVQVGPVSRKHHYHQTNNRNVELLSQFQHSTDLINFCTKFQKRPDKKWAFMYVNGTKAQLDHILINKKWKNSVIDCGTYNNFHSFSSDHKIVTINYGFCFRVNKSRKHSPKFNGVN